MTTTDRQGALHDKSGKYTEKPASAPGPSAALSASAGTGTLSAAQRRLLDHAAPLSGPDDHGILVSGHEYRTALSLQKRGLGDVRYQGPGRGWFKATQPAASPVAQTCLVTDTLPFPCPTITGALSARDAAPSSEDVTYAQLTQHPHAEPDWFTREMNVEPGWTQTPEILGTLVPYMRKNATEAYHYSEYSNNGATGGLAYFSGVDGEDAQTLLDHLPPAALDQDQNGSPSLGSMLKAAANHPVEVSVHGYYVPSNRMDERVSAEGIYLARPDLDKEQALDRLHALIQEAGGDMDSLPDEFDLDAAPWDANLPVWRAWWD